MTISGEASAAASPVDAGIQKKKKTGSGTATLIASNKEMTNNTNEHADIVTYSNSKQKVIRITKRWISWYVNRYIRW